MSTFVYIFLIIIIVGLVIFLKFGRKKKKNLDNTDGPPDDIDPVKLPNLKNPEILSSHPSLVLD